LSCSLKIVQKSS